jgi:hypothetical protein
MSKPIRPISFKDMLQKAINNEPGGTMTTKNESFSIALNPDTGEFERVVEAKRPIVEMEMERVMGIKDAADKASMKKVFKEIREAEHSRQKEEAAEAEFHLQAAENARQDKILEEWNAMVFMLMDDGLSSVDANVFVSNLRHKGMNRQQAAVEVIDLIRTRQKRREDAAIPKPEAFGSWA